MPRQLFQNIGGTLQPVSPCKDLEEVAPNIQAIQDKCSACDAAGKLAALQARIEALEANQSDQTA